VQKLLWVAFLVISILLEGDLANAYSGRESFRGALINDELLAEDSVTKF
jgi:hypothetical protein